MAEFESNHCTGCGYPMWWLKRFGHRPYCWRKVTMMLGMDSDNHLVVAKTLVAMSKHHRLIAWFIARREHTYYHWDQEWVREQAGLNPYTQPTEKT